MIEVEWEDSNAFQTVDRRRTGALLQVGMSVVDIGSNTQKHVRVGYVITERRGWDWDYPNTPRPIGADIKIIKVVPLEDLVVKGRKFPLFGAVDA